MADAALSPVMSCCISGIVVKQAQLLNALPPFKLMRGAGFFHIESESV